MTPPDPAKLPGPSTAGLIVAILLALTVLWLFAPRRPEAGVYEVVGHGGTLANWIAIIVALVALIVAIWGLRTNRASLELARRNARIAEEQRAEDAEQTAQLRTEQERRQANEQRERAAFLAQFEEIPIPPRADGHVFVWRYPRDWTPREDPPDLWSDEDLFDLRVAIWSLPDRKPSSVLDPRQHPNRISAGVDLVYLTDETREWRQAILHGSTREYLLGTTRRKGELAPRVCMPCRHITPQNCPHCGAREQDLPRADSLRLPA